MNSNKKFSRTQIVEAGYALLVGNIRKVSFFVCLQLGMVSLLLLLIVSFGCNGYKEAFRVLFTRTLSLTNGSFMELSNVLSWKVAGWFLTFLKILWLLWNICFGLGCAYFFKYSMRGEKLGLYEVATSRSLVIAFIKVVMLMLGYYLLVCLLGVVLSLLNKFFVHRPHMILTITNLANIPLSYLGYYYYFFPFVAIYKPSYSFRATLAYSAKVGKGNRWNVLCLKMLFGFSMLCFLSLLIAILGGLMLIGYLFFMCCGIIPSLLFVYFISFIFISFASIGVCYMQVFVVSCFTAYVANLIKIIEAEKINSGLG